MISVGILSKLPNELLLTIINQLSIQDVCVFRQAVYNCLPIIQKRINPAQYIKTTSPFSNIENLLDVMSDTDTAIIGARALDYCIPGLIEPDSAWEFYVPPIFASAFRMKCALEKSGAIFESRLDQTVRSLQECEHVILGKRSIISIAYELTLRKSFSPDVLRISQAIHATFPSLRNFSPRFEPDGPITVEDITPIMITRSGLAIPSMHDEEDSFKAIYGSATKYGKVVPIHLNIASLPQVSYLYDQPSQAVLPILFSIYSSHLQCMLTKSFAFHMYYKLSERKVAYLWDSTKFRANILLPPRADDNKVNN